MRTIKLLTLTGATLLGACNWAAFDDLSDTTWVDTAGSPDGFDSRLFGEGVAAGGVPSASGGSFAIVGRSNDIVASFSYDAAGALTARGTDVRDLLGNAGPLPQWPAFAGDPYSQNVALAAINGAPPGTDISIGVWNATSLAPAGNFPLDPDGDQEAKVVIDLAFGKTGSGDPAATDIVLARGDELVVISDYEGTETIVSCQHSNRFAFSIVAGDFEPDTAGDEVIVAVGNESREDAPSQLIVLDAAIIDQTFVDGAVSQCSDALVGTSYLLNIDPPAQEPDFGSAMVTGDFNGDGALDLAVASPATNTVYVYTALDIAGATAGIPGVIAAVSGGVAFGTTLAAGDIDGDGADELAIGDPRGFAEGAQFGGYVALYPGGDTFGTPLVLHDAEPEADQFFGQSLAIVPFGASDHILVVGADGEVFTYFDTNLPEDDDVRDAP
jgi:hypothetical protein